MKWVSHVVLTGTIAYAVTGDLLPTTAACVGAILPDKAEGTPGQVGWSTWRSRHRGWSHWPMLYLAFLGALMQTPLAYGDDTLLTVLAWVLIGGLCHIAEDAVCGKVPGILPTQKIGVRLFTVGSFREYGFVLFCIGMVYAIYVSSH